MTVKSTPAKGRRGGGARAGLGQGIGGASGGQVVKEGTPELKKVRPDITQVVKKKTRGIPQYRSYYTLGRGAC